MKRAAFAAASALALACTPSPRDVVPESRVVHASPDAPAPHDGAEAYVHVARRPHGAIALAEARHMTDEDARALVDRLADELERCAGGLDAQHMLVSGAARVVAVAGPDGTPAVSVRLAPGDAVAQNALLCIVAPLRAMRLPAPTASGTPGLAIESTWGPRSSAAEPDGGSM